MKFNVGTFTTPILYRRTQVDNSSKLWCFFWQNRSNFYYDEYQTQFTPSYGGTQIVFANYSPFSTPPPMNEYTGPYPFREITAKVVTHDIGNGEMDFQLDKVILDAQYDTKTYGDYQYTARQGFTMVGIYDPKLTFEARNTSYSEEVPTLKMDLIERNHQALQWVNPWKSRLNTPGGTVPSPLEFSSGDIIHRESIVLVTPFTKYRRGRIYLETQQKMTTVRSIQVYATEFGRKTYG